jgi:hypothetical protein
VATLTTSNIVRMYTDGMADRLCVYAMRHVTTADTVDLAADFSAPKTAIVLGTTTVMAFTAAISGTVLTIPAGLSADGGWLMVWGASA